jgi:hypothetical protein
MRWLTTYTPRPRPPISVRISNTTSTVAGAGVAAGFAVDLPARAVKEYIGGPIVEAAARAAGCSTFSVWRHLDALGVITTRHRRGANLDAEAEALIRERHRAGLTAWEIAREIKLGLPRVLESCTACAGERDRAILTIQPGGVRCCEACRASTSLDGVADKHSAFGNGVVRIDGPAVALSVRERAVEVPFCLVFAWHIHGPMQGSHAQLADISHSKVRIAIRHLVLLLVVDLVRRCEFNVKNELGLGVILSPCRYADDD